MPIISTIGRRSLRTRILIYSIYTLLVTGSVTMVYPFLLMIAGSSKSNTDVSEVNLIPRFLVNDEALWIKHLEALFNEEMAMMKQAYNSDAPSFRYVDPAKGQENIEAAEKHLKFVQEKLDDLKSRSIPAIPDSDKRMADARKAVEAAEKGVAAAKLGASRRLSLPGADSIRPKFVEIWRQFVSESGDKLPHYSFALGHYAAPKTKGVMARTRRRFIAYLEDVYDNDLDRLNSDTGEQFGTWIGIHGRGNDKYIRRRNSPSLRPIAKQMRKFKVTQPLKVRYYFSPDGAYRELICKGRHSNNIANYNKAHGTNYKSFKQIHLERSMPIGPGRTDEERSDWIFFVRKELNLLWVRAAKEAAPSYRKYLKAKYADIKTLNRAYKTQYASFNDVPLVGLKEPPEEGRVRSDWEAFLTGWKDPTSEDKTVHMLADEHLRVHSTGFMFRDYLMDKYGTLDKFNAAVGTNFSRWIDITPPQKDLHYLAFQEQKGSLRWEFFARNFITVWNYLVLHGRGVLNTAIYCILAVLGALLINPLAAYALSRYKPPSSYKVLMLLMLTMAFPPMVTQIPVFLMLRNFGMLNSFWALILPGLANGYSIFLLKGFFDSLPQELYESAELDGAGEFRIFWQITMSLSKPILAVIALGAFNMAYANFMFALLICQDDKMWTLMVWLYQLRQMSGQGVIYASLLIAAIPTFLIFVFCQRIIMRGIVVPVEK